MKVDIGGGGRTLNWSPRGQIMRQTLGQEHIMVHINGYPIEHTGVMSYS